MTMVSSTLIPTERHLAPGREALLGQPMGVYAQRHCGKLCHLDPDLTGLPDYFERHCKPLPTLRFPG